MADQKVDKEKVIAIRKKNPCMTLQAIGDACGISRERVRQILDKANLTTSAVKVKKICPNCGNIIPSDHRIYCSNECWYNYTNPQIECTQCHKLFRRKRCELYRRERFFCSRHCWGVWFGKHYGCKTFIDYNTFIKLYNLGTSYEIISEKLGVSKRYLYNLRIRLIKDGKLLTNDRI